MMLHLLPDDQRAPSFRVQGRASLRARASCLHILKARNVRRVMGCELSRQLRDPDGGVWLSSCDCDIGCGVVASMMADCWIICRLLMLLSGRSRRSYIKI